MTCKPHRIKNRKKAKALEAPCIAAETHYALQQWARWAKMNSQLSLGFPTATPYRRLLGMGGPSPEITDAEAMRIDGLLAQLQKRYPKIGKAVVLYYLKRCNVSLVSRAMGVYHVKVDMWIKTGTAWLDAALWDCR